MHIITHLFSLSHNSLEWLLAPQALLLQSQVQLLDRKKKRESAAKLLNMGNVHNYDATRHLIACVACRLLSIHSMIWHECNHKSAGLLACGVSCGSCLFVVVLSVLSLSCLDFPLGTESWSFLALWWARLCPRLAQHRLGFAHFVVISMVVSIFCCVCHRFALSLLMSNTWSTGFCAEHLLHV